MPNSSPPSTRDWTAFRDDLLKVAEDGDHEWMDDHEIKSVLNESSRSGLRPGLLISCRAAVGGRQMEPGPPKTPDKTRILVIDDEPASCMVLKRALVTAGFEVLTEGKPESFRDIIHDFRPDLLLLDMVMPLVDGLDILQALGEDDSTRKLPVIVLTGLIADSHQTAVNRGGVLFLAKPLSAKSLVHCIGQHLSI